MNTIEGIDPIQGIEEIMQAARYAAGWANQLETHLQALRARQGAEGPIIQAARGRRLAPGFEAAMARMITLAADDFEGIGRHVAEPAPLEAPADPTAPPAGSDGSRPIAPPPSDPLGVN